jgi:hypothetical protein
MTADGFFKTLLAWIRLRLDPESALRAKRAAQRRAQRAKKRVADVSPTVADVSPTPQKKRDQEEKKEKGTPIPVDWEPDEEGWRFAIEELGDKAKATLEVVNHRDYWLARGDPKDDWQAVWRRRVRALREPMLPLKARSRQLNVVGESTSIEGGKSRSGHRSAEAGVINARANGIV